MKYSLKIIRGLFLLLLINHSAYSQSLCEYVDVPLTGNFPQGVTYESKNGYNIATQGTISVLMILAEVNYTTPGIDPTPPNGSAEWPAHALPICGYSAQTDPTSSRQTDPSKSSVFFMLIKT